jgi:hypothetical protein
MTTTDMLLNFRRALLGVLPAVEAVGIPWKRPERTMSGTRSLRRCSML